MKYINLGLELTILSSRPELRPRVGPLTNCAAQAPLLNDFNTRNQIIPRAKQKP